MSGGATFARVGIDSGTALAITLSGSANKSLSRAVVHGLLSSIHVVCYALVHHFDGAA